MAQKQKFNLLVFDFETGGLQAQDNPALEIAVVVLDAWSLEEIDRYESYILPYKGRKGQALKIEPKALEYNGIKMSDVYDRGQSVEKVTSDLAKMFEKVNKGTAKFSKPILCGQNVDFDIPFLQFMFDITGKELKKYVLGKDDCWGNFQPFPFDTIRLAHQAWAEDETMIGHKLGDICNKIGFPLIDAHKAMVDVEATVACLRYFLKSMRNSGSNVSETIITEQKERARKQYQF